MSKSLKIALAAAVLIVLALSIAALVWVDSYQPLADGGVIGLPGEAKSLPGIDGTSIWIRPGKPFFFQLAVKNTGPFAVRIVSVPLDMASLPFHGRVLMHGPVYRRGLNPDIPFHPLALQPGQDLMLTIRGTYDCGRLSYGSLLSFSIPVRYTFLWRTSTAGIAPDEPVVFWVPKAANCPATQ